ncbi:LacI family DNA-binding transcriptional regulator [Jannaschia sp. LMIT008]|uniref:LacI family DNA-binding transcriptional regulator n=1 Tax=Jannaschia maritima TaxID=3032585 RepID=UPI002811C8D7|nr:LacI family DNA-binding transcriptional regulator [Jannaschia sp. LMIT008]
MGNRRITAQDVARHAGVSQSAVSRAFTPGTSVSPRMAAKVRRAAEELGYRPNATARTLITGRSRIVGLVVYYLDNPFYPDVVERLSIALQAEGYHVLLFTASPTLGDVEPVLQRILDYQVDAIVMVSISLGSTLARRCAALDIPVLLFNRDQPGADMLAVTTDNVAGGRLAARALLRGRPRRIAHLAGFEGASTQIDREAGFRAALSEAGHTLHSRAVGNYRYDVARDAARTLLARSDRPDALFCGDDQMAFAALDVARHEFGLRVPRDLAVVGYDDVPQSAWPSFDLTSVRQPVETMVGRSINLLMDAIAEHAVIPEPVRIEPTLVLRSTTRHGA